MEVALGRWPRLWSLCSDLVSILVFVEVALGHPSKPCPRRHYYVSILVFVEVALGHSRGTKHPTASGVSILVFVEVALGPDNHNLLILVHLSFNPCFRGSRPRTSPSHTPQIPGRGFNPCFRGSRPRTVLRLWCVELCPVSILVFVEVALGPYHIRHHRLLHPVSILVFVEVALGRSMS